MTATRSSNIEGHAPVLGTAYRSPWRVALDLWRARGSFRGFLEFAVIGAIVLWFLAARGISGDLVRGAAPAIGTQTASQAEPAPSSKPPSVSKTGVRLAPIPSDVAFKESYFSSTPEPLRSRLTDALSAYRARDYEKALEILQAADPSNRHVLLVRGIATLALPGSDSLRAGMGLLEHASELGEPRAMALLGILKISGAPGLTRDIAEGRKNLERASEAGDAAASRVIAEGFLSGWMGTVDPGRAAQYFRLASDRGDIRATALLADLLFQGKGVAQNHEEAERLLVRAAEGGEAEAQALLGTWRLTRYLSGTTDNPDDALQWLERAVAQGEPHAMEYLGMFYVEYGKRTGRADIPRGVELFRVCTERTLLPNCAFAYATALDNGLGVVRNPVQAYAMYVVSGAHGNNPKGKGRMDELAKTMSPDEIRMAVSIASRMLSKPQNMPWKPHNMPLVRDSFRDTVRDNDGRNRGSALR